MVEQKIALIEEAIEEVAEYRQDKSMDVEERRFLRTTELQLRRKEELLRRKEEQLRRKEEELRQQLRTEKEQLRENELRMRSSGDHVQIDSCIHAVMQP